jgi:hypothetical protein
MLGWRITFGEVLTQRRSSSSSDAPPFRFFSGQVPLGYDKQASMPLVVALSTVWALLWYASCLPSRTLMISNCLRIGSLIAPGKSSRSQCPNLSKSLHSTFLPRLTWCWSAYSPPKSRSHGNSRTPKIRQRNMAFTSMMQKVSVSSSKFNAHAHRFSSRRVKKG